MTRRPPALALALLLPLFGACAQQPLPIIDMHMHAMGAADFGPPPVRLCLPVTVHGVTDPQCPEPSLSPATDDAMIEQTVAILERRNIIGVLSGRQPDLVLRWRDAAPYRFIPGVQFELGPDAISPDSLRRLFSSGSFAVFGEVGNQYVGIAPGDKRMHPYWALAEKLHIPVAIHMEEGYPGAPYRDHPLYRAQLGNPFLLEDVLVRYPRLRVCVMRFGSPLNDEIIAVLYTHPQVYIETGGIQWTYPREYFYGRLKKFIDAGFGKQVMFGSDQMIWPGLIEPSIEIIEEAPFLSEEEKRGIFYNNPARFSAFERGGDRKAPRKVS